MTNIELVNVTVKNGNEILLDNINMKIDDGEYIGLLGPTGSGPSFILKVIAGLLKISSGKILINNEDVTDVPPEDRHIGFIFEQFNLFPHLNVLDNLLFGPRMRRDDIEEKTRVAREIINMVRLDGRETAMPRELSGGMQQRVGIARAMTAGAQILLLDQPYRALDAKIRAEMRFEIREIVKEVGLTAIHATHETEESMITSDKIAIFHENKLLQFDTPENIYDHPVNKIVASFLAESNIWSGTISKGIASMGSLKLATKSKIGGSVDIVVRQQACMLYKDEVDGENVFSGKVVKVRILGDFIRFEIEIDEYTTIISREQLDIRWENPIQYLNKDLYVQIAPDNVFVFAVHK